MKKIEPPNDCPSCGSSLEWSNNLLYCRSSTCPATKSKKVEHFAKTLKIKGLGPASIEKIGLSDICEIYELDLPFLSEKLGSDKLASNITEEIKKSTNATLNQVLPAFGIPLIGNSATQKLSEVVESIFDIEEDVCTKAGLGPKATNNLMTWLDNDFHVYEALPFTFEFEKVTKAPENSDIVCITGKLNSFKTKALAHKALEEKGYKVKTSLTKQVTILVNESGIETAKTKTARDSGIKVINNLMEIL